MTRNPTVWRVSFESIICDYGAVDFLDLLGDFLAHIKDPLLSGRALRDHGENTWLRFQHVPVFHKIKYRNKDGAVVDAIHIRLEQADKNGRIIPARFDTALVRTGQHPDNMRGGF